MIDSEIVLRQISDLKPNPSNARTHSDKQIGQIADSIAAFEFVNPVIVDEHDMILCGNGRVRAAQMLGLTEVPTIRVDHLSEADKRAYALAANRIAELAGWDSEVLASEFQFLLESDTDFEITTTGFETAEIDLLLASEDPSEGADAADEALPDIPKAPVSRPGDLWLLGQHRLLCADALQLDNHTLLLNGCVAQMVFTDPPYNVPINGHVSGRGSVKHREFQMASGEMTEGEFTNFLSNAFRNLAAVTADGSVHFVCMDWRHATEILKAGKIGYSAHLNTCVWTKHSGAMGALYRSQHEFVFVFKSGHAPHVNNVRLGKYGRNRTNVWSYKGLSTFQKGRAKTLAMHPTVKPVALVADAILDCSERGDIVLDPFVGSGTSFISAQRTGRRCYGMEVDPAYVDVSLIRFREQTGMEPICASSGQLFSERQQQISVEEL